MSQPPDFLLFLGRFHPVLVHLPIGLIVALGLLELLARYTRHKSANAQAGYILTLAVAGSVLTVVCGWFLSWGGGYEEGLLQWHKWTGVAVAVTCLIAGLLYRADLKKAYRCVLWSSLAILVFASHFGGSLTHGNDYLVRYAPKPLRSLLGMETTPAGPVAIGSEFSSLPAYPAVVKPILDQYCVGCHGPEKSKGKLRLDSLEGLLRGGESGPAIVAGKPSDSPILRRTRLPIESEDHMPPDGKPQPEADELQLLEWWIQGGASADKTVGALKPTPAVLKILEGRFGSRQPATAVNPLKREDVAPIAEKLATDLGISISFLSEKEPWVQANAALVGTNFGDGEFARLVPLAPNLKWLDLGGTGITDGGLAPVKAMANLNRLHLERTRITDAGLACLAGLSELEYLNVYGTRITDAGLAELDSLAKLKRLYLWQTKVSADGAKAFTVARTDEAQLRRWEEDIEVLKKKIQDARMVVEVGAPATMPSTTNAVPINAECPISGMPVDQSKTTLHEGRLIAFCCDDCKARFLAEPGPFLAKLKLAPQESEKKSP